MIIDIIGPGAIGQLTALSLPEDCTVRMRHPDWHQQHRLELIDDKGRRRSATALPLATPEPISLAVVTTKAAQAVPAVNSILPMMAKNAELLLLHNGFGPQDEIANLLAARPDLGLRVGVTAQGAIREQPTPTPSTQVLHLRHTGEGPTFLGPWQGECALTTLGETMLRSTMHVTWLDNSQAVKTRVWSKLIVNCAINPLTAILQVPNGALLSQSEQHRWQSVVTEATAVAQLEGIALETTDMMQQVKDVMQQTRGNYSSMYQDVKHHRTTEAAYILDPVIRSAESHRLSVPALRDLRRALAKRQRE